MTRKAKVPIRTATPAPQPIAQSLGQRIGWRALLIFALTTVVYSTAITSPLLFDDQTSIVSNASIRRLLPLQGPLQPPRETPVAGRPLVNLTFALNYASEGLGVRAYHVTNVAIHVGVALLLLGVVRRGLMLPGMPPAISTRADGLALATALLWALHPLNSEVVNYLTQRSESLMALCYLLTVYASLRAIEKSREVTWTFIAIIACFAGMASKESMVTAPVMVILIDRFFIYKSWREAFWSRRGLYTGLIASWMLLGVFLAQVPRTSAGFTTGVSSWTYLLNQAELIPRYLLLSVWPRALVLDYGMARPLTFSSVTAGFVFVTALGVLTLGALWRWPRIGFLGAWFFITLAPASSIVPVATEVGAERRMYLPLMALILLVVLAARALIQRIAKPAETGTRRMPQVTLIASGALAVACALMIVGVLLRNREYSSPLVMAQTIVDRWPNGRGHFLLASELVAAGRHDEAMAEFRASARDYPGALFALGTELVAEGQLNEGAESLLAFIKAQPTHAVVIPAREMLSSVYLNQNRLAEADEQLRLLLERVPNHAGAHRLLGDVRLRQGNPAQAVTEYQESLRIQPAQAEALGNLGFALASMNRFDEAVNALREAVARAPGDANAHFLLGRVLAVLKKYEDARAAFQAAFELDPNNRDARTNLESVQRLLSQTQPASAPASRQP